MISLIAIIVLRESEFHKEVNVVIFGLCFLFKLKQIVQRVIEEDVTLDDFVAFDVELVLR
jgi:hypothetical protein